MVSLLENINQAFRDGEGLMIGIIEGGAIEVVKLRFAAIVA